MADNSKSSIQSIFEWIGAAFVIFIIYSVITGNSEPKIYTMLDETIVVEPGKFVSYTVNIRSNSTVSAQVQSTNSQEFEFFIMPDKQYSALLANMSVNTYLYIKGLAGNRQGTIPEGKYKLVIRHTKSSSWFGEDPPNAHVAVKVTST